MPQWMLGILLAPLAYELIRVGVGALREREVRLAIPAALLLALGLRHLTDSGAASAEPDPFRFGIALGVNVLAAAATHVVCSSLVERNRAERTHWDSMEALRHVTEFLSGTGEFEPRARELLALGAHHLGLEIGALSRIESDDYVVALLYRDPERGESPPLREGETLPLGETYCAPALATDRVLAIEGAAGTHWEHAPAHERLGFESYLGIALRIDGKPIGTLCFADRSDRARRFSSLDKMLLRVMATWLEAGIARDGDRRALAARADAPPAEQPVKPAAGELVSDRKRLVPRRGDDADRRRLDLAACLLQLEDAIRERLGPARHLDLRLDPAELEARLYRYEFDRVLWSLVHHAAEWPPARGPVAIATSQIAAAGDAPEEPLFLTLSVHALQCAPDASETVYLFERGSGAPRPRDARRLPLWRAAEILRGAGGDLSLSADVAGGATLTAYLPAVPRDD